eukprot:4364522-Amphidinium_carterae.1
MKSNGTTTDCEDEEAEEDNGSDADGAGAETDREAVEAEEVVVRRIALRHQGLQESSAIGFQH